MPIESMRKGIVKAVSAGLITAHFETLVLGSERSFSGAVENRKESDIDEWRNGRSKTKDFCSRIGAKYQIVQSDTFFRKVKPDSVLSLMASDNQCDVSKCNLSFKNTLQGAIGR